MAVIKDEVLAQWVSGLKASVVRLNTQLGCEAEAARIAAIADEIQANRDGEIGLE